jgi:hypothetical protein
MVAQVAQAVAAQVALELVDREQMELSTLAVAVAAQSLELLVLVVQALSQSDTLPATR